MGHFRNNNKLFRLAKGNEVKQLSLQHYRPPAAPQQFLIAVQKNIEPVGIPFNTISIPKVNVVNNNRLSGFPVFNKTIKLFLQYNKR